MAGIAWPSANGRSPMTDSNGDLAIQLDEIIERVRANFAAKHAAREQALGRCREAIRNAAMTIRSIHRGEQENARRLLEQCRAAVAEARAALAAHADIYFAGFVHDAQKEY